MEGLRRENYNFADVVGKARGQCEANFTQGAKEAVVSEEEATWNWEEELGLLKEEVRNVADQLRKDETKKMVNAIEVSSSGIVSRRSWILSANASVWIAELQEADRGASGASAHEGRAEHVGRNPAHIPNLSDQGGKRVPHEGEECVVSHFIYEHFIEPLYTGFDCTDEENNNALAILRKRAWLALRAKIDEQTADTVILGKLRAYFEERFRYDEHGVPRVWRPDDDIDGAFKKARDQVCPFFLLQLICNSDGLLAQTLELIPLYSKIEPVDPALAYKPPPRTGQHGAHVA